MAFGYIKGMKTANHPTVPPSKIGIILVHLGTPEQPNPKHIRRFLRVFLQDRRVIEVPKIIWWCILNGIILPLRPRKIQHAYQAIWDNENDQSPLKTHADAQLTTLSSLLDHDHFILRVAYRYSKPCIASVIKDMQQQGARRILVVPQYPQYSATTTASVRDEVFRALMELRWQPNIRFIDDYADHPAYIKAIQDSINTHLGQLDWKPDHIITSYHGLPEKYLHKGDPYHCFCHKTTRLLKESMGLDASSISLAFQSRFGREPWLQPYLEPYIESLPAKGIKKIAIVAPGFSVDCLETLEEINIGIRETFMDAGGEQMTYIPCLNASDHAISLLKQLITEGLQGWHPMPLAQRPAHHKTSEVHETSP